MFEFFPANNDKTDPDNSGFFKSKIKTMVDKLLKKTIEKVLEKGSKANLSLSIDNIAYVLHFWKNLYKTGEDRPKEMLVFMSPKTLQEEFIPLLESVNAHYSGVVGKFAPENLPLGLIPTTTVYIDGIHLFIFIKHEIDVVLFIPYTEEKIDESKCIIFEEQ